MTTIKRSRGRPVGTTGPKTVRTYVILPDKIDTKIEDVMLEDGLKKTAVIKKIILRHYELLEIGINTLKDDILKFKDEYNSCYTENNTYNSQKQSTEYSDQLQDTMDENKRRAELVDKYLELFIDKEPTNDAELNVNKAYDYANAIILKEREHYNKD